VARVAALDIGKASLTACVRVPHETRPGTRRQEVRTYVTTTRSLLELRDWLVAEGVSLCVMEATSTYWKPHDPRPAGRLVAGAAAAVTITGAVIAVAVAVAASPLMPIGHARLAEPHPGIEVNLAILAAGFAAIAVLPLAVLVPVAWRAATRAAGPLGVAESAAPAWLPRLGSVLGLAGSVPASAGVRMAFEPGHGRTACPSAAPWPERPWRSPLSWRRWSSAPA
jgi:hypothetical protein